MIVCFECLQCRVTFGRKPGACRLCGEPLTPRAPGAVPYGRDLEDDDLALTADDDVVLVRRSRPATAEDYRREIEEGYQRAMPQRPA